ncbi:MAG: ABC transporter permease, partial [Bacteroidetes bacterium]|nr:ABC transporter permease [Candidatus Merdivivens pullicola]
RNINTRKIAGASTASLRASLTCESLIISIAALIVSFFLAGWLSEALAAGGLLNGIFSFESTGIILTVSAITIVSGIAAGLYPGWYATSYPPALVLKGDFGLSRGGRTFRNIMSGIQYTVAFVTLIFMTFVLLQNRHMRSTDLGFDTDMTAVADVSAPIALRYDFIKTEAASYPSIEGVTFSTDKIGSRDTYSTQGIEYEGQEISCLVISVKDDFFSTLGIGIIEGRDFNTTDAASGGVIVSKYFKDMYGIKAGDIIMGNIPVTGICDNVKFNSARESNKPIIFMPISDEYMWYLGGTMYFRLKSGSDAIKAASEIESLLKKAAPDEPVEIEFYDTILDNLYQNELRTGKLVVIFSIIAVILTLGGVVGLVLFDTQYKKKETSVRKIFGASVGKILERANTGYALIVLVCFIIACPIAVLVTSRWLQNFTDRITLYPWVFILVLLIMSVATSLIVTGVFYRRATTNPQEGLN